VSVECCDCSVVLSQGHGRDASGQYSHSPARNHVESPALQGRRALVTGASGALGATLLPRLEREGATAKAFVRRIDPTLAVEQAQGDIRDEAAIARALDGVDCVVHCAAAISADLSECHGTNVAGTSRLLRAMLTRAAGSWCTSRRFRSTTWRGQWTSRKVRACCRT